MLFVLLQRSYSIFNSHTTFELDPSNDFIPMAIPEKQKKSSNIKPGLIGSKMNKDM
tara:strand:+ start:73 stop:240 length:168 start_codon:yes stop_codon:yes gene_type:complete